jgi:hypothetical protein
LSTTTTHSKPRSTLAVAVDADRKPFMELYSLNSCPRGRQAAIYLLS